MNIRETIKEAKRIYLTSTGVSETEKGIELLRSLPAPPAIDKENEAYARAYAYRLTLKKYAFGYFTTLSERERNVLVRYIERCMPVLAEKFPGTRADFARTLAAADALAPAGDILAAAADALVSGSGLGEAAESAENEAARLRVSDIAPPLGGAAFIDVRATAASLLENAARECRAADKRAEKESADALIAELAPPLGNAAYDCFPDPERNERGMTGAIVLCTPLTEEAKLYVRAVADREKREFALVSATALAAYPEGTAEKLFAALASDGRDALVVGASHMPGGREELFSAAAKFALSGRKIYIADDSGALYKEAVSCGVSASSLGRLDLALPFFRDVMGELEERGMAGQEDKDEIKKLMPFAGYTGLNAAITAFAAGRDWKAAAEAASRDNAADVLEYISRTGNPGRLVDPEWGDFSSYRKGADESKPAFDYDDIRVADPANIRRIMTRDLTVFERVGALTRYCLLGGADESAWKALDEETRDERMEEATRLVYRALGISYIPEVSVEDDLGKGVGGLCCNGGRVIKYLASALREYRYSQEVVIHESYHAFQHEALSTGWRRWHWTELGVPEARLNEWQYNFANYYSDTSSKGYKVEIVEGDARAFSAECIKRGDDCWNTIDLQ